jgi:hypothetical protein
MEVVEVVTVAEIVAETEAEIVVALEADEAEAVIVVVTVVAQAAAGTRKATADQATGQLTKVAETAEAIQAVQQPVRIRTEVAADLRAENHGIRNKPGNPVRRRKGFN